MSYTIVIGMVINQKFENGDVVPQHTAIHGDYCHTIISCVGKAPATIQHDEPTGEIPYHQWKNLLNASKGFKLLNKHIEQNQRQIIYLNQPNVQEIITQIETELPKWNKPFDRDRAEWLVFWAKQSIKRYGANAAIGLF